MKMADRRFFALFDEEANGEASAMRDIGRLWILPIVGEKPKAMGLQTWLEKMFHTEERTIHRFFAEQPFQMPGLLKITPEYMVPGMGYRKIKPGIELWVRRDSTRPDVVEIECDIGRGSAMHWFHLTKSEWESILPNLRQDRRIR